MIQIKQGALMPNPHRTIIAFHYPFRIFFLSSAVSALLLIPLWLFFFLGAASPQPTLPALHWHQHEMLGGFVNSAIAGFILTAVCAWTGTSAVAGWRLGALWLLWLLGRVGMLIGLSPALAIAIDLAFLPAVALLAARPIFATRQWRQMAVLAALALLWLCDLAYHLSSSAHWLHTAMLLVGALILLIGGRITPTFSRNWLLRHGQALPAVTSYRWLEVITVASTLLLVAAQAWPVLPSIIHALLAFTAAIAATVRLMLWRGWRVRSEPLLLILHIGVLWVCVAFALRGLSALDLVSSTAWLHTMGVGAFGTMILGVMSRVALGHTGRPLVLPAGMKLAFVLVLAAGIVRVASALGWVAWTPGIYVSALCWMAAFAIYLWRYFSILTSPRIDGKAG